MLRCKTNSPAETVAFGRLLASLLTGGQVICLEGDLGAGKTLFVQGLASGLGIEDHITSPTFTLMNYYEAKVPLYHFDLYRLERPDELYDIGFYEYISGTGIIVIEWSDKFPDEMPAEHLRIMITQGADCEERYFEISAYGAQEQKICEELKKCPYLL